MGCALSQPRRASRFPRTAVYGGLTGSGGSLPVSSGRFSLVAQEPVVFDLPLENALLGVSLLGIRLPRGGFCNRKSVVSLKSCQNGKPGKTFVDFSINQHNGDVFKG